MLPGPSKMSSTAVQAIKGVRVLEKQRKLLGFHSWIEVAFALLTVYMIVDYVTSYIGIRLFYVTYLPIIGFAFAWYQLHILASMSENLKKFEAENERLKGLNDKLEGSIETFKEQNTKLKEVSDALAQENGRFHDEVTQLHSTISGLETVRAALETYASETKKDLGAVINTLNETLIEQKKVVKQQQNVLQEITTQTKCQEKILLLQLQAQCQYLDGQMGMSPSEFSMFVNMIPAKFRNSKAGLAFDNVDTDKDGVISNAEFQALVEELVRTSNTE